LIGYFTDRVANDILDPPNARAIVLSCGDTTLGLVICDPIVVPGQVVDTAKARIHEQAGVPPENVLIAGAHTHSGPQIADAFILARRRLQPAQFAHAAGSVPLARTRFAHAAPKSSSARPSCGCSAARPAYRPTASASSPRRMS
jgi:hypothetical protein